MILRMTIEVELDEKIKRFLDVYSNPTEFIQSVLIDEDIGVGTITSIGSVDYFEHEIKP